MHIEEAKTCVISNAHLPYEETKLLKVVFHEGGIDAFTRAEGFMVNTISRHNELPTLMYILGYMNAKGYDWVMFDRDADTLPVLEIFDW